MYELKTELLEICEAFNLGAFISSRTLNANVVGFIHTEFTTEFGIYQHYFKIKENEK